MKEQNPFRASLAEKFSQFEAEPSKDIWPQIAEGLEEKRKIIPMWLKLGSVAAALILLFCFFLVWQNLTKKEQSHQEDLVSKEVILNPTDNSLRNNPPSVTRKTKMNDDNEHSGKVEDSHIVAEIDLPGSASNDSSAFVQQTNAMLSSSQLPSNAGHDSMEFISSSPEKEYKLEITPVSHTRKFEFDQLSIHSSLASTDLRETIIHSLHSQKDDITNKANGISAASESNLDSPGRMDSVILIASRHMSNFLGNDDVVEENYKFNDKEEYRSFSIRIGSFTFSRKNHKKLIN